MIYSKEEYNLRIKKVKESIYDQKIINYSGEKSIVEKINKLRLKINQKTF